VAPLLALTGFMGSGKTAVGHRVADLLGWRFTDLDEAIVSAEGCSISEFFATKGEAAFRVRERELLESLLTTAASVGDGLVLALGGGTLESDEAAALLRGRGEVVYLATTPAQAWSRVEGSERPLARDRYDFDALFANRRARYEEAADWIVPVGRRTVEELARDVAELIRAAGEQRTPRWGIRTVSTARPSLIMGGHDALLALERQAAAARDAGSRLFGITDENVMRLWGGRILPLLGQAVPFARTLVFPAGEQSKSAQSLERCWDWLAGQGARRDDVVVALGGGVIGDLAGFAAATYQRGISLWQIPTSLLAQVDSSVGGKTAINLEAGKNLVGSFYQPDLVVIDPTTLSTLPDHDYTSGLGEVVKYGLLDSEALFAGLEKDSQAILNRDTEVLGPLVKKCVLYKTRVVEEDELDRDRRAVLNLGHTVAHALEASGGYGSISHGRAVALGLLVALAVSERLLGLDPSVRERTRAVLVRFGLPVTAGLPAVEELLAATSRDKKVMAGSSGFVGLHAIGDPVWGLDVPGGLLLEALEVLEA
jgi:shikimate kinase / 3-dehydroquinate synthase